MALVYAYDKTTGKKLTNPVPERWIDHPVLGANLTKTPRQKASETRAASPAATKAPAAGSTEKE